MEQRAEETPERTGGSREHTSELLMVDIDLRVARRLHAEEDNGEFGLSLVQRLNEDRGSEILNSARDRGEGGRRF